MPCSDDALRTVWEHFDKARGATVDVPRKALNEVLACHRTNGWDEPETLLHHKPRANSAMIECNRAELFAVLKVHVCS